MITFTGVIRAREFPAEWTQQDYHYWWLPDLSDSGRLLRLPRMSEHEKARYTVYEARNLLTTQGRDQLLLYIANGNGALVSFGKIFSVGNFPLISVSPGDTSVANELGRVVPGSPIITGSQVDIPCAFGATQFPGRWTNVGFYGGNSATTVNGTGILFTHALYNYQKVSGVPVSIDYLISLT